jgi:hypothetical protein
VEQIKNLNELWIAAQNKRAVHVPSLFCYKKASPAAWVIHFSGEILLKLFNEGMFIYNSKKKSNKENK